MTSAEDSVLEPPNLKMFWGGYPPPPYMARTLGTRDNAPPPPPVTKTLATALEWPLYKC